MDNELKQQLIKVRFKFNNENKDNPKFKLTGKERRTLRELVNLYDLNEALKQHVPLRSIEKTIYGTEPQPYIVNVWLKLAYKKHKNNNAVLNEILKK